MTIKRPKWCGDCRREDDEVNWCDLCSSFVCIDCDNTHECLVDILGNDDDDDVDPSHHKHPDDDEDEDFSQLFPEEEKESEDD